jgi:hypothetical protein
VEPESIIALKCKEVAAISARLVKHKHHNLFETKAEFLLACVLSCKT